MAAVATPPLFYFFPFSPRPMNVGFRIGLRIRAGPFVQYPTHKGFSIPPSPPPRSPFPSPNDLKNPPPFQGPGSPRGSRAPPPGIFARNVPKIPFPPAASQGAHLPL